MRRLALIALLSWGCGLDEQGQGGLDASFEAGDSAVDVKDAAPFVCADAGPASCTDAAAAAFRSPALYAPNTSTPCPAGYDTHDYVLAVPKSDCSCACNDAGAPSCDTTLVSYQYGFGNCNTGSGSYTLSGCTTTNQPTFAGENVLVTPPKMIGGCGGAGTPIPSTTTSTTVRVCTPQCASDETVCKGTTGFRACAIVTGDVKSCPAEYEGGAPIFIGTGPGVTCDPCSCTQSGDCAGSIDHLFTDTGCTAGDTGFVMDGVCHALASGQVNSFRSAKIQPVVQNAVCTPGTSPAHADYSADALTVCCQ